ncbi:MAG TPA: hypothetical protein VG711_07635, partial [Phycisphaerales bacterium]|nr:hypothetical protein [Phycisphaerales bacterium]
MKNPFKEIAQDAAVLLDDEDYWVATDCDTCVGFRSAKISVVKAAGEGVYGEQLTEQPSDANQAVGLVKLSILLAIAPENAFIQPVLGLAAEIIVHSCEYNDKAIARVHRLTDQAAVICRLARLHAPDNHP